MELWFYISEGSQRGTLCQARFVWAIHQIANYCAITEISSTVIVYGRDQVHQSALIPPLA